MSKPDRTKTGPTRRRNQPRTQPAVFEQWETATATAIAAAIAEAGGDEDTIVDAISTGLAPHPANRRTAVAGLALLTFASDHHAPLAAELAATEQDLGHALQTLRERSTQQ